MSWALKLQTVGLFSPEAHVFGSKLHTRSLLLLFIHRNLQVPSRLITWWMFTFLWVIRSVNILPLSFLRPFYLIKSQDIKYFLLNDFLNLDLILHSFMVLKLYDLDKYFKCSPVEFWIFHWLPLTCHSFLAIPAVHSHKRALMCNWKISSSSFRDLLSILSFPKVWLGWSRRRRTEISFLPLGIFLEKWINSKNLK